jgi:hypothetical protein
MSKQQNIRDADSYYKSDYPGDMLRKIAIKQDLKFKGRNG